MDSVVVFVQVAYGLLVVCLRISAHGFFTFTVST